MILLYLFTVHAFALPKLPITQIKPDKQSRQEALRDYCPNIYTVVHLVRLTQGQTQEDYVSSDQFFLPFLLKLFLTLEQQSWLQ